MRKIIILASTIALGACAYHRFESIDTCEVEIRDFWGLSFWASTNCLGEKTARSHVYKVIEESRVLRDEPKQDTEEE